MTEATAPVYTFGRGPDFPEGYTLVCLCCGTPEGEVANEHCEQHKYQEPWREDENHNVLGMKAWMLGEGVNYLALLKDENVPTLSVLKRCHSYWKKSNKAQLFTIQHGKAAPGELLCVSSIEPVVDGALKDAQIAWHMKEAS